MGQERWYVALPGECALLKRALIDHEFGMWLGSITIFKKGGHCNWFPDDKMYIEFCDAVKQMNVEHPGIAERVFTLDRAFDKVHYLLSEARRTGEYEAEDMGTKAVCGATTLPHHLRAYKASATDIPRRRRLQRSPAGCRILPWTPCAVSMTLWRWMKLSTSSLSIPEIRTRNSRVSDNILKN